MDTGLLPIPGEAQSLDDHRIGIQLPGGLPVPDPPRTADFVRQPLAEMIDLDHPLAVLASRLPWASCCARWDARANRSPMHSPWH